MRVNFDNFCKILRVKEFVMYKCPHCKKHAISFWSGFQSPFTGIVVCKNCGTAVRQKQQWTNFLVVAPLPVWWVLLKFYPQPPEFEVLWLFILGFLGLFAAGRFLKFEEVASAT